jgi:hypothetical protein
MERDASTGTAFIRKVGTALGGLTFSRRSFFTQVAVVGSALSLDPFGYATKPASAYASVCGDDASCAGGFSVVASHLRCKSETGVGSSRKP